MSGNNKDDISKPVPFFARYLEGQLEDLSEEEMEAVVGGEMVTTLAYPSDQEGRDDGIVTTKKYPSDQEDSGFTPIPGAIDFDFPSNFNFLNFPKF
jgi:Serine endopeptidase inhibitors